MSQEEEAAVFRLAVRHWSDGNFEGVLALLADDIVHSVNVDALQIPWVSSAEGKPEVSARLKLIIDTFVVDAFVIENLVYENGEIRATVLGYHVHRKTRERLDVRVRFRVRVRDGLIVRIDEFLDAAYIEAFERFVRYLEQAAQQAI
ncbi:nuclear transport factor 2 family protein [Hyphomicrobium sp.]|uniref:nuclear transport factor 2 family protein n=1 Tax=Hyphomicrobium sp. TaxID=82 RepID=UPI0025C459DC|nr:nuclear transport factor 2 family protein [Hyphomicrobium sp.]MCC7253821.1 nuclear transport factor 2 family protein [Hyphomicrobium sp.]